MHCSATQVESAGTRFELDRESMLEGSKNSLQVLVRLVKRDAEATAADS